MADQRRCVAETTERKSGRAEEADDDELDEDADDADEAGDSSDERDDEKDDVSSADDDTDDALALPISSASNLLCVCISRASSSAPDCSKKTSPSSCEDRLYCGTPDRGGKQSEMVQVNAIRA